MTLFFTTSRVKQIWNHHFQKSQGAVANATAPFFIDYIRKILLMSFYADAEEATERPFICCRGIVAIVCVIKFRVRRSLENA